MHTYAYVRHKANNGLTLIAGQLALGRAGQYLVASFALSEFFGGGCMMLIIMWRIVMDTLPDQGTQPLPQLMHGIAIAHFISAQTLKVLLDIWPAFRWLL